MSQKYYYFRVPNQTEAAGQIERVKEANFFGGGKRVCTLRGAFLTPKTLEELAFGFLLSRQSTTKLK
jgi:hypothetical protein